ncbi:acetyltransferase, GNAT family [Rhodococcus aetherivorans]|uniref:Acetyltransferase, GNAT family n=1 Tax=Rhodococcus aetherivorans TaxID=191292 RepID=A0ABQ0YGV8_9NOCA|nr:GNAT family protein [Rhodococcus aetherivorans]ETT28952.1 GCN5-related N-acetyltransferase [Rhodococcus rhodochrous ATCC 21198]NGP25713.1 GNAT family N-acetyltransferase [Rhodococcus aetherivorans]GES35771.1 acetyltransferase, GNAT family [Rhodococcus aetherivorans]
MSTAWYEQPVLDGTRIRLEPLAAGHAPGLLAAVDDADAIFRWTSADLRTRDDADAFVRTALDDPDRLPYAVVDKSVGAVVGTTSYYLIDPRHRTLAVGHTWLSRAVHGGAANPESKLLLLRRAFDDLGAVRVEWHTDEHNAQSRAAITRLGAGFEGLLRKHRRRRDGSWRTTALFAMTDDDWPAARVGLEARVADRLAR